MNFSAGITQVPRKKIAMSGPHPCLCRGLLRGSPPSYSLVLIILVSVLFLPLVSPRSAHCQTATFQGVGDLPGGIFDSRAYDISPDGSVIVGRSVDSTGTPFVAFMWTELSGIVQLGEGSLNVLRSTARAVSANGEVIVGQFYPENSSTLFAFRWTTSTGMVALVDTAAGFEQGQAFDVSSDGQYIIGIGRTSITPNQAFRWNASTGVTWLGWLPSNPLDSAAYGVSADGSAVCGLSFSGNEFGVEVFRWTQAGGMVGLGDVPGGEFYAIPHGISEDGTTIIGQTRVSPSIEEIFIWREGTGYILPDSAHGYSVATSTTSNGSIVTATGLTLGPVLWDEQNGFRSFVDILTIDYGLDITGWSSISIAAVSADGSAFAGEGTNPDGNKEGWFARLPGLIAVSVPTPQPRYRFSVTLIGANPFVSRAEFRLQSVENLRDARATIHGVDGSLVRLLYDGATFLAGEHHFSWNGEDSRSRRVPRGVYFLRFSADGEVVTKKLVRLR